MDASVIDIGAVGMLGGNSWDEKGRTEIVQIFVWYADEIRSLQFQYFEDGNLVLSVRLGSGDGYKFDAVKLNYPSEYLTCVSGFESMAYGCIRSITFTTNLETYGPFGGEDLENYDPLGGERLETYRPLGGSKAFRFQLGKDKQFGGFYGSSDGWLKSIGVYMKPIRTLNIQQNQNQNQNGSIVERPNKYKFSSIFKPFTLSKIAFLSNLCFCFITFMYYYYYYQYSRQKCFS